MLKHTKDSYGWGEIITKGNEYETILCPICGNRTRGRMREDTELRNFPLFCPKCKRESLIDVKDMKIRVVN